VGKLSDGGILPTIDGFHAGLGDQLTNAKVEQDAKSIDLGMPGVTAGEAVMSGSVTTNSGSRTLIFDTIGAAREGATEGFLLTFSRSGALDRAEAQAVLGVVKELAASLP